MGLVSSSGNIRHNLWQVALCIVGGAVVGALLSAYVVCRGGRDLSARVNATIINCTAWVALGSRNTYLSGGRSRLPKWHGPYIAVLQTLLWPDVAPANFLVTGRPDLCFCQITTNGSGGRTSVWVTWVQRSPPPDGVRLFFGRIISAKFPTFFDLAIPRSQIVSNLRAAKRSVMFTAIIDVRQNTEFGQQLAAAAATHKLDALLLCHGERCSDPLAPFYLTRSSIRHGHGVGTTKVPSHLPPGVKLPGEP